VITDVLFILEDMANVAIYPSFSCEVLTEKVSQDVCKEKRKIKPRELLFWMMIKEA